jgi:cytochrome c peroxidase
MTKWISYSLIAAALLASCNMNPNNQPKTNKQQGLSAEEDQKLLAQAQGIFKPVPAISENPNNPITPEKVKLGKFLYFDTRLSKTGNNSCNSCHNLNTFGVDNLATSPGDEGKNGNRNSPTSFNAALHTMQFWDGRAKDVEEQAGMPVMNPVEMNIPSEDFLIKRLKGIELYKQLFASAFPDEKDPLTFKNMAKAIGAFERTLITPSKFDEYLHGKSDALSYEEKKGLQTFINEGCTTCHNGVAIGGNSLQKFGSLDNYRNYTGSTIEDEGRKEVTKDEFDKDLFKTPSLRNITKTAPYFHDGSVEELSRAITIMGKIQLGKDFSPEQVASIKAFLEALTGDIPDDVKQIPAELEGVKI